MHYQIRTMAAYLAGILLALASVAASDRVLLAQWSHGTPLWRLTLALMAACYLSLAFLPTLFLGFTLQTAAPRIPHRSAPAIAFLAAAALTLLTLLLLLVTRHPAGTMLIACLFFLAPIPLALALTQNPPPATACRICTYDLRAHLAVDSLPTAPLPPRCPECGAGIPDS